MSPAVLERGPAPGAESTAGSPRVVRRKGILLAGGAGTRLHPMTSVASKQLLPVYDKPLVYYPLSTLMLAGVRDILVITAPEDADAFRRLLGDGGRWGLDLRYEVQPAPEGIAQAYVLGRDFLAGQPSVLVLGDNIFFGQGLAGRLQHAAAVAAGATLFGYWVNDPERYGVAELDADGSLVGIEEKPVRPASNYAITGLYFYDGQAAEYAASLTPSPRGELEITDLNRCYLEAGTAQFERLGRGVAWLDTGTPDSLLAAANFVQTIERRQGLKIACPEEIAWRMGFIDAGQVERLIEPVAHTAYGAYLTQMLARDL